ncbi:2-oxoglutarate-dependent dioxygenase [Nocardia speluncae]|uniref:2-oxoglutarate-dependent dioxygenase n=1 Tax=Nocardia speluncae TaxID=419477 RepID=A0A846XHG8_9NOCA|nr:2OG-Fe(II) oxygenase [Nocardia speluncae]NKY35598.1 2-oxoglutarate-dependent dioxygenase [Nocardia speluncae]
MTGALDISWQRCINSWISENLEQGHDAESIAQSMTSDGFDKETATAAVHRLLAGEIPEESFYEYDSGPVPADRSFYAHDRMVHTLLRTNNPQTILFDDVLSPDECDQLIELSRPRMQPSRIIDAATGHLVPADSRASESWDFEVSEDPFIDRIDRRISALMNWPLECGEGLQVVHYGPGGEFLPHFDFYPPQDPGSAAHFISGGQRTATLIVYLNDVEAGGETAFTEAGLSFTPRKGQALYFRYFNNIGQLDPMTRHAGLPVTAGEKWIVTKWMRRYRHR